MRCSGVKPRTNCRYWVNTNSAPNRPNITNPTEVTAPEKARRRNRVSSSMDARCDAPTRRTPPAQAGPQLRSQDRRTSRARAPDFAHTTTTSPMTDSVAPTRSGRLACSLRESGTSGSAHRIPAAAIGTLSRNTDPHQKCSSNSPPTNGPMAIAEAARAAHNPIARWRSAESRNMSVMIASVDGMISAAPTPIWREPRSTCRPTRRKPPTPTRPRTG